MCADRGYLVSDAELNQTLDEFKQQFGDNPWFVDWVFITRLLAFVLNTVFAEGLQKSEILLTLQTRSCGLLTSDVESSYGRPVLFYKINIIPVVCNFDYNYKPCSDVVYLCEAAH